jgi:hypothetical protein
MCNISKTYTQTRHINYNTHLFLICVKLVKEACNKERGIYLWTSSGVMPIIYLASCTFCDISCYFSVNIAMDFLKTWKSVWYVVGYGICLQFWCDVGSSDQTRSGSSKYNVDPTVFDLQWCYGLGKCIQIDNFVKATLDRGICFTSRGQSVGTVWHFIVAGVS